MKHSETPDTENQETIAHWAKAVFGPATEPLVLVDRAQIELDELRDAVVDAQTDHEARKEVGAETADILILLYRLLTEFGLDKQEVIDAKMQINRSRKWNPKGDGTGNHVKDQSSE